MPPSVHDGANPTTPWFSSLPQAFLLCATAALCLAPLAGHIDDVDAQTYLVIARKMARSKTWFDPSFLPSMWPHFREHLPFGFWPAVAGIRLAGERAVPLLYAGFAVIAAGVVARTARRIAGNAAGLIALLVIGTCESFWHYSARLLLEPPLFLLTALSVDAWVAGRWRVAGIWASLAVLVKGPFGLLPVAAVALSDFLLRPTRPKFAHGTIVAGVAVLPVVAFLLADRTFGDGSWFSGYLERQLFASATGARQDGVTTPFFALRVVAGRFWPGLPLVLLGMMLAIRGASLTRTFALGSAIAVAALSLPVRKWGNHVYVVFPLLAVLSGVAAAPWAKWRFRASVLGSAALALGASLFALAGGGRLVLQPPCEVSNELAEGLATINGRVAVIGSDPLMIAELAAEQSIDAVPATTPIPGLPAVAPIATVIPAGYSERSHGRRWKLLVPTGPP